MNLEEFVEAYLLNEKLVPMSYSYEEWLKSKQAPGEYEKKHPGTKWKIVHCHKRGEIGKPLRGATNLSYEKATKMHQAIMLNDS